MTFKVTCLPRDLDSAVRKEYKRRTRTEAPPDPSAFRHRPLDLL